MHPEIWVAIPSNVLEDGSGLRAKTEKAGAIARAAAIFGIQRIYLYNIRHTLNEAPLIELLLNYLVLPQYLRKKVYPIREELRFAGQLPPLKIPSHQVPKSLALVNKGDIREGIVIFRSGHALVDVGLEMTIPLALSDTARQSERVTVVITSGPPKISSRVVERNEIGQYWGYEVIKEESLKAIVSRSRPTSVLLTSRRGTPLREIWMDIIEKVSNDGKFLVIFGSPRFGLFEVLAGENLKPTDIGAFAVNLFPDQNVETVRSEEAILAGLGILNFLRTVGDQRVSAK